MGDFALIVPPEDPPRDPLAVGGRTPLAGAKFINLSPAVTDEMGLPTALRGVMAVEIARGSPAQQIGFRPGDILRDISGVDVTSVQRLREILRQPPQDWRLTVEREGELYRVAPN